MALLSRDFRSSSYRCGATCRPVPSASIPLLYLDPMESISNTKLFRRVITAALGFGSVGFLCGYFGPLYLLEDPGVGPLTGFLAGPIGVAIGGAVAVWASASAHSPSKYAYYLICAAMAFAIAVVGLVLVQ